MLWSSWALLALLPPAAAPAAVRVEVRAAGKLTGAEVIAQRAGE